MNPKVRSFWCTKGFEHKHRAVFRVKYPQLIPKEPQVNYALEVFMYSLGVSEPIPVSGPDLGRSK